MLGSEICEGQAGARPHLLTDERRHADPAWLGQRLYAGCDVQTVAVHPRAIGQDIAMVDADAKAHLVRRWHCGITLSHRTLDGKGTVHRLLDAPELRQNAITSGGVDAPARGVD